MSAALPTSRLVMSRSSGLSSGAPASERGSSAIPHSGQLPARSRTTSGCMGQVHDAARAGATTGRGSRNARGVARNRSRQRAAQKT